MATYDEMIAQLTGGAGTSDADEAGELQRLVDALFQGATSAEALQLVAQAEICDVSADVLEVVNLLPGGTYTRTQMADQLNSIITAHGWGLLYGTVQ